MPHYIKRGEIPSKRHVQFRNEAGHLYTEEVMGVRGFSGIQSILYHCHPSTQLIKSVREADEPVELITNTALTPRHLNASESTSSDFSRSGDPIRSRVWFLGNQDVHIGISTPTEPMKGFYRNALADEVLFVHRGSGSIITQFGALHYCEGDYIILPVGTTYKATFTPGTKFLVIESTGRVEIPRRYMNEYGQLLEHAPFCERDFREPEFLPPVSTQGEFDIRIKLGVQVSTVTVKNHPFDVIGWDGYLYPWIFNIKDFEPITGRIHQPPPVHQTFSAPGFVVCSFVPRLFDYHPEAIPVPYAHSNVNSDEVLYYVAGNFMSRKGIRSGSFTVHPAGIPHGPHPGTIEASLGAKETHELAVMVDTFHALYPTKEALQILDEKYERSWI